MVPDLDMSGKLDTIMEISPTIMENGNSVKLPEEKLMICASNCEDNAFDDADTKAPEEKLVMTCANNCQDNSFDMEVSPSGHDSVMACKGSNEDVEVDVIGNVNPDEDRVALMDSRDVTESSSSFGCTDSGVENGVVSSDMEVESQVRDDNSSLLGFDGFSDLFKTRKKKLTAHWRKFIRPLMWRCKWVELQIRELHSQASKYDKELAECDKGKQCQLKKCATEELGMKSTPFICQDRSVKLMKRKKRRRVEESVDIASYTSSHSLFSYYLSRRRIADSAYMDDDHGNAEKTPFAKDEFGANAEWTYFEFKDSDAFESVLRKIEEAQLQVRQLRVRMDKVVRDHAGDFASDKSSFAPGDMLAPNSVLPHVNSEKVPLGSMYTTSRHTSEKKLPVPESAASNHGDATPIPDMVESTDRPKIGGKCEKMENEILLTNHPVKEELVNTEEFGIQRNVESQSATEGKLGNLQHVPDPNSASKLPVTPEQPPVKIRSISKLITPKNKRKRGRRKARSSRWSRKSSG